MKKIELLAPAGSWESLEATVKAGADAVYLAGQQFGARKSAQNFSDESLLEAIQYCHMRGVKVYLTVNTLLSDGELGKLEAFLTPLYQAGIDAFIIQDLGVFHYLRRQFPEMNLHCSTQMALQNVADVAAMKALGASRVVLPREINVKQIHQIQQAVEIELEAFVHGALCVSVSGQCLMSSLIGGRSGNRGNCAQSCRQKYKLIKGEGEERVISKDGDFLISPRDLMTIDQLEEIVEAGVTSLKIEGRMKGPEYSYAVTKAYRTALDAILGVGETQTEEERNASKEEMRRIFNREFTTGFILGTDNKSFISQEIPGNRGILLGEVLEYDRRNGEMLLSLVEDISKGDDMQVRGQSQTVGGRVEYLRKDGKRVDVAQAGTNILVNFKHEVPKGTQIYRTYDQQIMKQIQLKINDAERTSPVTLTLSMEIGEPLRLKLDHVSGLSVEAVSEISAELAMKTPLSNERIQEQLEKMGGTPFHTESIEIHREGNETVPVKALNQLRRDGIERLTEELSHTWERPAPVVTESDESEESDEFEAELPLASEEMKLVAMVRTPEQFKGVAELGIKTVYIYNLFETNLEARTEQPSETLQQWLNEWLTLQGEYPEVKAIPYIGRFVETDELVDRLTILESYKTHFDTLLVSSIGQLEWAKSRGFKTVADFSLNVFNQQTAQLLFEEGAQRATLSLELNDEQIEHMLKTRRSAQQAFEIIGYGKIPVMVNRYCPINGVYSKDKAGCQICRKENYYIEDKTGAKFLVKGDAHCQVEIFNSAVLNLADEWPILESMGIDTYRLNFVDENIEEVNEVVEMHLKAALDFPLELRGKGYTKGHFKRGVL